MRWIATNAGHEGSIVVQRVKEMKDEEGFNAQTEQYENLVQAGVIDPTKVVRSALQNAASIASLLLTTEAVISQIPERAQGRGDAGRRNGRRHVLRHITWSRSSDVKVARGVTGVRRRHRTQSSTAVAPWSCPAIDGPTHATEDRGPARRGSAAGAGSDRSRIGIFSPHSRALSIASWKFAGL